jgi:DNA polymerase-3 subunit alpha
MIYFYGLKELSLIEDTLSAINAKGKNAVDFDQIPLDNRKTFELILSGNTNGVFSDEFYYAIEDLVKRIKPDRFEDLMALIALCGLAPLECGLADKYILCKQSKRPADLIHKSLIAPTAETYGLFLYHEQIVQCIAGITGCSTGEANRIRKSMAKNNPKIITEYRKKFISDSTNNGISSRDAGDLFNFIKMNARHTYPKTRCAEYALQIYRSAWLKANCPDEFMEAYLSRSMFDKALISAS